MAAPGCGIIFAPSQRIDRSTSLRRSHSLNFKSSKQKRATIDRSHFTYPATNATISHGHSRSLSDKMRSLRQRKEEEPTQPRRNQPTIMPSNADRRNPRHLDLMEAVTHEPLQKQTQTQKYNDLWHRGVGTGKENMVTDTKQREGPAPNPLDQSFRQIAYNHYISQAFGLAGDQRPKPVAVQRLRPTLNAENRPDSDMSARTNDSMQVNFHMNSNDIPPAKDPNDHRPKIQVTIPSSTTLSKRPRSTAHLAHQLNRQKTGGRRRESSLSQVSPPSTTTRHGMNTDAPARMSVVSPLSTVEMPKPRRPFSALSLEDMTKDMPHSAQPAEKTSSSDSSDDTGDHDDKSSVYSGRSSTSSLTEELESATRMSSHERRHSFAFSVVSPTAAGVFDGMPLAPRYAPKLRSMKSSASLTTVNTNKPLPPEPGMEPVAPLRLPGTPYSRSSSMHGRRNAPSPLSISRASTISLAPSRKSSLRSKYTPADLDALDAAFTKTSPNLQVSFYNQIEPSLSQAQLELEAHLGTINEESGMQGAPPVVHDPLQISRGPNNMVPSRSAPAPPSSMKRSDGSTSSRKRLQKKPSHVALQIRSSCDSIRGQEMSGKEGSVHNMPTLSRSRSSMKAERILGTSGMATPMERETSAESNWSSSGSPHDSSSPTMSREDSSTPETDVSSIPDAVFEEVRARLELLNPKNDTHHYFRFGPTARSEPSPEVSPVSEPSNIQTPKSPPESSPETLEAHDASSVAELNADAGPPTPAVHVTASQDDETHVDIAIEMNISPNDIVNENVDESDIHPLERRGRQGSQPRSLASIAMSEIRDMYASLPSPVPTLRPSSPTEEEVERTISADAAEKVLYRILENLDNLEDLFSTATVSRGFYRTFKRHELPLMKNALYSMSPSAWELREMSAPYPSSAGIGNASPRLDYSSTVYLQHYMRDMYTMIALKSMILVHCESFLRADTITALAGGETERATQIDDAFWRVWTFCQVFGCGSNREDDITGQMDWLRGGPLARQHRQGKNVKEVGVEIHSTSAIYSSPATFGRGNQGGLSPEDLYDMTEIWTCLGVLVRGFQGKRQEARDHGVFQNADVTKGDIEGEDAVLGSYSPLPKCFES